MPTMFKWNFVGGTHLPGRDGEQRAFAGDNVVVIEPDMGNCTLDRMGLERIRVPGHTRRQPLSGRHC